MKGRKTELSKELALFDAVSIIVGIIVGTGIFIVPGLVAGYLPSSGMIMLVWIAGGVLTLFGVFSFMELSSSFPETGGIYIYLKESMGSLGGFLFGWASLLILRSGSIAAMSVAFAMYTRYFFPLSRFGISIVASIVILILSCVNYIGVKSGSRVQNFFTSAKVIALGLLVFTGFFLKKGDIHNFEPFLPSEFGWNMISFFGMAMISVLWTFDGWADLSYISGEVKNPEKNLPLALIIGTIIVTVIFLLVNLLYIYLIPVMNIKNSELIASDAAVKIMGGGGGTVITILILITIFGAINGSIMTGPRIFYAQAKDGLFFKWIGKIHPKYGTPSSAIIIQAVLMIIMVFSGTFEELMNCYIFMMVIFYILCIIGLFILRKKKPELKRPQKTIGYPFTSAIFLIIMIIMLVNTTYKKPVESIISFLVLIAGIPVYYFFKKEEGK
ncbi:amino acid permease [candidate division KSB1 bacterium]|nr:MAG: amino acid permease [candidate division KSB1 bacterium]